VRNLHLKAGEQDIIKLIGEKDLLGIKVGLINSN
jgi:hypothetical protein